MSMNPNRTRTVRDFIYVDQDRLYSFYSQINKGVAQQIFKSIAHGEAATESQSNPDFAEEITESQRSKSLQRTENTILYDYIYEQLEDKLEPVITDLSSMFDIPPDESISEEQVGVFLEAMKTAFMIRVKGKPEIIDYERLDTFLEKSNSLMEAVVFLTLESTQNKNLLQQLQEQVKTEKDKNEKAKLNERIRALKNHKLYAQQLGVLDNKDLLTSIRTLIEIFLQNRYEISIQSNTSPHVTFRGIINREWLRIDPSLLRSLYMGSIESTWTLVGQITTLFNTEINDIDAFNVGITQDKLEKSKSIREPLKYVLNRLLAMETMVNQSERFEPIVYPLAIYREIQIPDFT